MARLTKLVIGCLVMMGAFSAPAHMLKSLPSGLPLDNRSTEIPASLAKPFVDRVLAAKKVWQEAGGEDLEEVDPAAALYWEAHPFIQRSASFELLNAAKPLNEFEIAAIVNYSNWSYQSLNQALYKGQWGDSPLEIESEIRLIVSGLNKLPPFEGISFRGRYQPDLDGQDWDEAARKEFNGAAVGSVITFDGFGSSTLGESDASVDYVNGRHLVYEIRGKTGRLISMLSTRPEEKEVLFLPASKFRVVSKNIQDVKPTTQHPTLKRIYRIVMEELE